MKNKSIDYPSAADLDTGHARESSGYQMSLYLVPAMESDTDRPKVTTFGGYGNPALPAPAWHGRWAHIITVGPMVVGDAMLRALQYVEDELVALSDQYRGSSWDGSNLVGKWGEDDGKAIGDAIERELSQDDRSRYWDCGDWLVGDRTWPALADLAEIDPERVLSESTRSAAIDAVVAEIYAAADDDQVAVCNVREYVELIADEYDPEA